MAAVDARPAPAPAAADSVPVSRPAGLWLLTIALLVGPIVHLVALWLDLPDEGLVDVDAGTPVRWVEGKGWKKGRA